MCVCHYTWFIQNTLKCNIIVLENSQPLITISENVMLTQTAEHENTRHSHNIDNDSWQCAVWTSVQLTLTWIRLSRSCSSAIFCCSTIFFISANNFSMSLTRSLYNLSRSFCVTFVRYQPVTFARLLETIGTVIDFTRLSMSSMFKTSMACVGTVIANPLVVIQ